MSSTRFLGTIHGSRFDAGVVEPRPDAPQTAQQTPRPPRDYDRLLLDFKTDDPELRATFVSLRDTYIWALRELDKIFDEQDARAQAGLKQKHENLKANVRAIRQKIAETNDQMRALRGEILRCKNAADSTYNVLQSAQQARAQLDRYASAGQIKRADAAIAKAQEEWNKVKDAEAAPTIEHNRLAFTVMHQLSEELREAEAAELDLELVLTGRHATNSLGIHV